MALFGTSLFTFYWQLLVPAALMFYPMPKRKGFIWRLIICLVVTIAVSLCYYSPYCIGITDPVFAHFIFFSTAYSFCVIIVHVCFQLPFSKGLFFLFETFVIQNVCYHLFSLIMQLAGVPVGDEYSTFLYLLVIGALYALVYLLFFWIVEKRHLRNAVSIPRAALLVEAFFFFIDMFIGVYFRYGSDMLLTDTLAALMYRILSLAVGFLIISLCLGLFNIGELTDNNKELAKRIEFESRYYEISKNYAEEIRKVRHDLKHQINAIRTVQDDETREGILKELEESIKRYGLVMKTGNTALDSVLLEKNVRCNNLGLSLNIMADGSLLKGMTYNDIYVLFGKTSLYDADNKTVSEKVGTVKKVAFDDVKITKSVKGVTLQNQLSDMDPSKQWNLTMLSRSDWDGTFPKPNTNLVPTDSMKPGLECKVYTLTENNNGGKSVVWNAKNGLTLLDMKPAKGETVEYDDPRLLALVQNLTLDEALRNLQCAGGSTFLPCKSIGMEITAYQNDGPMGFDGNNGDDKTCLSGDRNPNNTVYDTNDDDATGVNSTALWGNIAMRPLPTNVVVGSTFDKDLVEEAGECIGVIGAWVGNMAIWGPGSNIHRTPYNTRNHEYYSEDPIVLGVMSDVFSKGGKAIGLVMCPKHYAFNDYDLNRSGIAPFLSEQDARENALRGFQYAFESGNAMGSMGAFGRAGATFCSANKGLMTGILRSEWAWNGMFVTDMVNPGYFMNARDSIAAGSDGMLTGASQATNGWFKWNKIEGDEDENNVKGEIERSEVEKDLNFQQCLQDSMHRYFYAILNSNYTNGLQSGKTIEHKAWYDKTATACIAATSTLAGLGALAYVGLSLLGKKED